MEHDPWATQRNPGAGARAAMTVVAWSALAFVLVGAVVAYSGAGRLEAPPEFYVGLGLVAVGLLEAALVVWHGVRHAHERGRRVAVATILVGLVIAMPLLLRLNEAIRRGL